MTDRPNPDVSSIAQQVLPTVPDVPDAETEDEISDYEEQHNRLALADHKQNIDLRKEFAKKIYWLVIGWVGLILAILIMQGFKIKSFSLSDPVLLALIGSSTLNIVGLLYVVTHYLFPKNT